MVNLQVIQETSEDLRVGFHGEATQRTQSERPALGDSRVRVLPQSLLISSLAWPKMLLCLCVYPDVLSRSKLLIPTSMADTQ